MTTPSFVDISAYQGTAIDWQAYKAWSAQGDGISRVALKATEGTGFIDPAFATNRANALAAGIDVLIMYHFARPDINNPQDEANFMHSVVGDIRPQDIVILDFEENTPNATAEWAYEWLAQQGANYGGKIPGIYASSAYILERLQDQRLSKYNLWLANWQFTPDERPACPPPWSSYEFVQYTDKAVNIPGVPGTVDADIFLGKETPIMPTIPQGWTDDGTPVVLGFRQHILGSNWDPNNIPLEPEQHCDPLEHSNASLGAGQRQRFRWITLEYTDKMGVFEAWTGPELLWYEQQYQQLLAKVADLQQQLSASQAEIATLTQPAQLLQQLNGLIAQASTANAQIGTVLTQAAKLSQVQ